MRCSSRSSSRRPAWWCTPFLPGDSILFVAGTVVAVAGLNVHFLVGLLVVAAMLGDSVNYSIGHYIGPTRLR